MAGFPGGGLRLACVAEPGVDGAGLDALCRAVGEGMADALGREVAVVEGAADVSLRVVRLDARRVRARLQWAGREPGPEVDLGSEDALLTESSYRMLARGLLAVSPPP